MPLPSVTRKASASSPAPYGTAGIPYDRCARVSGMTPEEHEGTASVAKLEATEAALTAPSIAIAA